MGTLTNLFEARTRRELQDIRTELAALRNQFMAASYGHKNGGEHPVETISKGDINGIYYTPSDLRERMARFLERIFALPEDYEIFITSNAPLTGRHTLKRHAHKGTHMAHNVIPGFLSGLDKTLARVQSETELEKNGRLACVKLYKLDMETPFLNYYLAEFNGKVKQAPPLAEMPQDQKETIDQLRGQLLSAFAHCVSPDIYEDCKADKLINDDDPVAARKAHDKILKVLSKFRPYPRPAGL